MLLKGWPVTHSCLLRELLGSLILTTFAFERISEYLARVGSLYNEPKQHQLMTTVDHPTSVDAGDQTERSI